MTKTEELLDEYEPERPGRTLEGFPARLVAVLGAGLSIFAIFWVFQPLAPQVYRPAFLAVALLLTFVAFGRAKRPTAADYVVAGLALLAIGYAVFTPDLVRRAARPETLDIVFGVAAILVVLEATRRTTGWALPAICLAFLVYAFFGGLIPDWLAIGHKGYGIDRIVGQSYMGLEGIFGIPLDVAATYIVLFAIYGAVLEFSGAARFFVEISFAAFGRSKTGPGRTSALAGFLLGTVSGSGVATTVTLGSVAWPLLRKAGYPKDQGGGVMAASGIGAILSPPTLGAAAFIIAELLEVSYLQVLVYALIPSVLYYVGILMAIEADARRHDVHGLDIDTPGVGKLLARWGYHFSSLFLIVILLAVGFSAFRAVIIATVVAFLLSFLDRRDRMGPKDVWESLVAGARSVLPIAATTAAAGIIVAVVTLTGLGLKLAGLIVDVAGGSLALTAILSAVAVLILGLAVPVTASFIIAAAVVAPALIALGVEDFAAYMFIFYYAVLSEVSPPTALSAFAAAAITGGNGFKTMMLTCRYTLPAFLVPFAFILAPRGEGLLMQGGLETIAFAFVVSVIAVIALGLALEGWLKGRIAWPARAVIGAAALLLLWLEPTVALIGLAVLAAGLALHFVTRRPPDDPSSGERFARGEPVAQAAPSSPSSSS
ncbi:TRAP transporter fused permease subunit [Solirubrobacter sp. CPCC 204708]|uniref:TRAP transporter fused permease subunit n=1 Tax=Solirubrobacter deserti TaxID=2282478 RepID=A0ABT4RGP0_9ACTN|nr:TRAP transporter fused permease subunit [Solirubrobacter deserti]MBE2315443.1 TRAP transporter fused permease subunit [Solirubrobacter deserti]MDA0137715.1 TRAP transporter fused permease subunit [Solirubrobacter deserti]